MKKVLSLVLAALMLLSCMSISVFAEDATTSSPYFGQNGASESQAVLKFKLGGGTCKSGQYVYDTQNHVSVYTAPEDIGDTFVLVPTASDMYTLNSAVTLPSVKGPKGYNFVGWQRASGTEGTADRRIYSSAPGQYIVSSDDIGKVVEFVAVYEQGEVDEDTFAKVFEILTKIFGTIIGLIAYNGNIQKGQDFMNKIFSSLA